MKDKKKADNKKNSFPKLLGNQKSTLPLLVLFLIVCLLSIWMMDWIWRSGIEKALARQEKMWLSRYVNNTALEINNRMQRISSALESFDIVAAEWYEKDNLIDQIKLSPKGKAWHYPGSATKSEILIFSHRSIRNELLTSTGGNDFDPNINGLLISDPAIEAAGMVTLTGVIRRIPGDKLVDKIQDQEELISLKSVRQSAHVRGKGAAWFSGGHLSSMPSPQAIGVSRPVIIEGTIKAVVFVEMDGAQLLPDVDPGLGEWSMIVDSNSNIVATDSMATLAFGRIGKNLSNLPQRSVADLGNELKQRIRGESSVVLRGKSYNCYYLPLASSGWKLIVAKEKAKTVHDSRQLANLALLAIIILSLLALLTLCYGIKCLRKSSESESEEISECVKNMDTAIREIGRDIPLSISAKKLKKSYLPILDAISATAKYVSDDRRRVIRERERYKTILDSLDTGVAVMDLKFKVIYANEIIRRRHGSGIVGQPANWIMEKSSWASVDSAREAIEEKIQRVISREIELAGEKRTFQVCYFPIVNVLGNVDAIGEMSTDITEIDILQKAGLAATTSDQVSLFSSKFVIGTAKELAGPISKLSSSVQIMKRHPDKTDEVCARIMEDVAHSTNRIEDLISNIYYMAKLESEDEIKKHTFPVSEIIERSCNLSQGWAEFNGVNLLYKPGRGEVMINSNPEMLGMIIKNLLHNSIKFAKSGDVSVEAKRQKSEVIIEIKDSGLGMNQELIDWIHSQNITEKTEVLYFKDGAIRLGFTLVVRLVRLLNGKISAKSEENEGTKIFLYFPLR